MRLRKSRAFLGAGHRVDVPRAAFEGADERVDVVPVGVEGAGDARDEGNLRGVRLGEPLRVVVGVERVDGLERQVVVEMEQHVHGTLDGRLDRVRAERLAVELHAREVEQPGVVLGPAEVEVAVGRVELRAAQVGDVEGRVRGPPARTGAPPRRPGLSQVLELRLVELQAAPEDVDDRIAGDAVEDARSRDSTRTAPLWRARSMRASWKPGEVDEGDPRHREVMLIGGGSAPTAPPSRAAPPRSSSGGTTARQSSPHPPHSCRFCRGSHPVSLRLSLRRPGVSPSAPIPEGVAVRLTENENA